MKVGLYFFFRKGQRKTEKGEKCVSIFYRSTITCMKGLKHAQITKKKKKYRCYQSFKPKKASGSNNQNLGKVYAALDNYWKQKQKIRIVAQKQWCVINNETITK